MIKISNSNITDELIESLRDLLNKDISPKIAFELLVISDSLEEIINKKNTIHKKILDKYAVVDPSDPTTFSVSEELVNDFQSDMSELMNIEHDFNVPKINVDDLNLVDKIKVKDLINLKFLFEIEPSVTSTTSDKLKEYED